MLLYWLIERHFKYKVDSCVKTHEDTHYAFATFRYHKEFCITFRDFTIFTCMDDKYYKVGEPGNRIAAVEWGETCVVP